MAEIRIGMRGYGRGRMPSAVVTLRRRARRERRIGDLGTEAEWMNRLYLAEAGGAKLS